MVSIRDDALTDLAARIGSHRGSIRDFGETMPTCIDALTLMRSERATPIEATCYEPVICLILQGRKEIEFGPRRVSAGRGQSIIVSHDLPIRSRIVEASAARPYLVAVVRLDVGTLRSLTDGVDDTGPAGTDQVALGVSTAGAEVVDTLRRLVTLADNPADADVLAPLVLTELHYRLLQADHSTMLRRLLRRDSHASRIAKAIARIREDLAEPLSVPELARVATMSASTFHQHFKEVTATTPLQYQKSLRLLEARRRIRDEGRSVTEAAFEVGYQSSTQFSREYLRTFGVAPREDRPNRMLAS
jgi:AraC-like DNA-binding protein